MKAASLLEHKCFFMFFVFTGQQYFFLFDHTAKSYVLVMTNSTLVAMAQQAKANRQVCINKKKIFKKGQKNVRHF
jgi:hypothetical protein